MPAPRPSNLMHIPVRLRVTVDPKRWAELYDGDVTRDAITERVRKLTVTLVQESAAAQQKAIVSARRDGA